MLISREQDQHILNLANSLIGKFQAKQAFKMFMNMSVVDFSDTLRGTGVLPQIDTFVRGMSNENLGEVLCAAVNTTSRASPRATRQTFCQDVLKEKENIFSRTDDGGEFLREVAKSVIIAAMYDILMTELWIMNVEEGNVHEDLAVYEPKPAMKDFVRTVRLHELLV